MYTEEKELNAGKQAVTLWVIFFPCCVNLTGSENPFPELSSAYILGHRTLPEGRQLFPSVIAYVMGEI